MQSEEQRKFILTPLIDTLQETVNACKGIGQGIETQALGEYVLQTTFLKMTGAQEQKLKCICWEMATNDYGYRYQYLKKNYGECSTYADKNSIYKDLMEQVKKMTGRFDVDSLFEDIEADTPLLARKRLFEEIQERIDAMIGGTLVTRWEEHNYLSFMRLWKGMANWSYALGNKLMGKELQGMYWRVVYEHRNRCAHNLVSIQKNLPTLRTLEEKEFVYDNYYFRFGLLVLVDEVFVRLFRKFVEAEEKLNFTKINGTK